MYLNLNWEIEITANARHLIYLLSSEAGRGKSETQYTTTDKSADYFAEEWCRLKACKRSHGLNLDGKWTPFLDPMDPFFCFSQMAPASLIWH